MLAGAAADARLAWRCRHSESRIRTRAQFAFLSPRTRAAILRGSQDRERREFARLATSCSTDEIAAFHRVVTDMTPRGGRWHVSTVRDIIEPLPDSACHFDRPRLQLECRRDLCSHDGDWSNAHWLVDVSKIGHGGNFRGSGVN